MELLAVIFWISMATGLINLLHYGFYLVNANLYDIWQFKRQRKASTYTIEPTNKLPLVSIVISAHNEEKVIVRTLDSLMKLNYPYIQVIVVDDASADNTTRLVNQFIADHPEADIIIRYKTSNIGKGAALNSAISRFARGDLIMTLDADSILHPDAVRNAVRYFDDPKVVGVAANVRIIEEQSVLSLLQMLEHMIGYRSKKAYSLTNSECIIGGVASTYRASTLKEVGYYDAGTLTEDIGLSMKIASRGNKKYRLVYAADVVAATEGVDTFKGLIKQRFRWKYGMLQNLIKYSYLIGKTDKKYSRMLTWYRLPMAFLSEIMLMLEPILLGYVLYLSYLMQSPASIVASYLLITGYILLNVLPDEHSDKKRRFRLALYAPMAYFIFYIMNLIQFIAIIRCLFRSKQLIRKQAVLGTWHSPARRGTVGVTA